MPQPLFQNHAARVFVLELSSTIEVFGDDIPCRGDDPELFFAESPEDVEFAKALCRSCAVRVSCLEGALQRQEPWGVWGGEIFERGVVIARKRPRGRPRKEDVAREAAERAAREREAAA